MQTCIKGAFQVHMPQVLVSQRSKPQTSNDPGNAFYLEWLSLERWSNAVIAITGLSWSPHFTAILQGCLPTPCSQYFNTSFHLSQHWSYDWSYPYINQQQPLTILFMNTNWMGLTLSLYNSRYEHHRDLNNGLNEAGHLYHLRYQLYLYLNYVNKLN